MPIRLSPLLALLFLVGCSNGSAPSPTTTQVQESKIMTQEVSIKLGEQGDDFARRVGPSVRITHSTPKVDTYQIDWERPRGKVTVEHGIYSFDVLDSLGIISMQELTELRSEGLNEFDVSAGMSVSPPGLIPHDEARLKFFELLRSIKQKGWKPVVYRDDPRLSGKARFDYMTAVSKYTGLDPDYLPTFDEWMSLESRTTWPFCADHVYLDVTFTRESTLTDPSKPGSYLLSFNLKTEREYFRGYASPEDRPRWKEVVPAELKRQAAEREKKEAALKATGIKIDESYQDPPIPEFK